jgi:hypothetical protein
LQIEMPRGGWSSRVDAMSLSRHIVFPNRNPLGSQKVNAVRMSVARRAGVAVQLIQVLKAA